MHAKAWEMLLLIRITIVTQLIAIAISSDKTLCYNDTQYN